MARSNLPNPPVYGRTDMEPGRGPSKTCCSKDGRAEIKIKT